MNQNLWTKLINEEPLDAAECLLLEQMLEDGDESLIAMHLKSVSGPEPSLAWRSTLNQQLRQIAPANKRRTTVKWIGAVAVAACALALGISLMPHPSDSANDARMIAENNAAGTDELGEALVKAHQADEVQVTMGFRPTRTGRTQLATYEQW